VLLILLLWYNIKFAKKVLKNRCTPEVLLILFMYIA
jgi:hypothetical protein